MQCETTVILLIISFITLGQDIGQITLEETEPGDPMK